MNALSFAFCTALLAAACPTVYSVFHVSSPVAASPSTLATDQGQIRTSPSSDDPSAPPKGMVYVPGGTVTVGMTIDDIKATANESLVELKAMSMAYPAHEVTLEPYYIDQFEISNQQWKVYLDAVDKMDFNLARGGWIGDYVDPNTFLDLFVTGGGNNNTGWSHKPFDDLIAAAGRTGDQKKRFELFLKAEKILVEEQVPIIPVYIYVNQGLLAEKVAGWYENVLDHHTYQYIYIDPVE